MILSLACDTILIISQEALFVILTASAYSILPSIAGGLGFSFMSMIEELNLQRIDYEEMLINYFMILLISLHRIALQKPRKKNLQNMNDIEQAAQYFRMHYNKPISIEDYAVSHNMSISWFIQNFRQYANTTPAQYVQSLRLTNAKMLLETTNYNITEIANLVGYENPLYFSRFFRKQCGMSPSQFRKQLVLNAENCPKSHHPKTLGAILSVFDWF